MLVCSKNIVGDALLDKVLEQFADVPTEDEIDYTFSKDFENRMNRLLQKTQDPTPSAVLHFTSYTLKRVVLIAALVAVLAATAFAAPVIQKFFVQFFVEDASYGYAITFDPEQAATAPKQIETVYKPHYIPKNFEAINDECGIGVTNYWFGNAENEHILFSQFTIEDVTYENNWLQFNANATERSSATLSGYKVEILTHDECIIYIWTDSAYLYTLQVPSWLAITEVESIIASVDIAN